MRNDIPREGKGNVRKSYKRLSGSIRLVQYVKCVMKFRTEIEIETRPQLDAYRAAGFSLGSCFAGNMAERMTRLRLPIASNPFGVLFNPLSMAGAIEALAAGRRFTRADLVCRDGVWTNFAFHGSFADPDPDRALGAMNDAVVAGGRALREADYVILTFGTAWVFELAEAFYAEGMGGEPAPEAAPGITPEAAIASRAAYPVGEVVANCHKFPARAFTRRRLSVDETVERYARLMEGPLADKRVILTVSPVRHLKDGFAGNGVSKATLLLAAAELEGRYDNISYFPAFEIMNDDLRDYRFYAADMLHPAPVAVDYIWELFSRWLFTPDSLKAAGEVEKIAAAAAHRPLNPDTAAHAAFMRDMLRKTQELRSARPEIDLSAEAEYFAKGAR